MDARMGDGDLGLTMQKGYGALPELLKENMQPKQIPSTGQYTYIPTDKRCLFVLPQEESDPAVNGSMPQEEENEPHEKPDSV